MRRQIQTEIESLRKQPRKVVADALEAGLTCRLCGSSRFLVMLELEYPQFIYQDKDYVPATPETILKADGLLCDRCGSMAWRMGYIAQVELPPSRFEEALEGQETSE